MFTPKTNMSKDSIRPGSRFHCLLSVLLIPVVTRDSNTFTCQPYTKNRTLNCTLPPPPAPLLYPTWSMCSNPQPSLEPPASSTDIKIKILFVQPGLFTINPAPPPCSILNQY